MSDPSRSEIFCEESEKKKAFPGHLDMAFSLASPPSRNTMVSSNLLLLLLLIISCCITNNNNCFVCAKKVSGSVKLSGSQSEVVLTKFALAAYAKGRMDVTFTSQDMYEDESSLRIHLYLDSEWKEVQKRLLCDEKVRLAQRSLSVEFDYSNQKQWTAHVSSPLNQDQETRPHYWYIVLDDCMLERRFRDYKIPEIYYDLTIWNDVGGNQKDARNNEKVVTLTHLSADEMGSKKLHVITLVLSLVLTFLLGMRIGMLLLQNGTVHAALLLVMAASACDTLSSLCQIIHLNIYETNGYGSYTLDAMSSHFEAICDSLVALLLLSIAAGWTLPSDAVHISTTQQSSGWMASLVQGLRSPVGALVQHTAAGWLALTIIAAHAILAQWGRTYNDDFDSYHALEHLPGRVLMVFRVLLGILLVMSSMQTASSCDNVALSKFYTKLAIVGTLWFQSLPLVTWICGWALPYYQRHPAVATGAALVQSSSLMALAWLVTAHSSASSYHKLSRLQQDKKDVGGDLTDQLASTTTSTTRRAAPSTWKIGKTKLKVRLD